MNVPKPKYSVGQSVYVFTPDGLVESRIFKCIISIEEARQSISYTTSEFGTWYKEDQIHGSPQKARRKLEENANQLQLLLN